MTDGIVRGLKGIKKRQEELERRRAEAEAGKIPWLILKDNETVEIRFLQELDEEATNYSAKNDLGFIAIEHNNPKGPFWKKALCTYDSEGSCHGEEMHRKLNAENNPDYKGQWKQKERLYINVLVRRPGEEDEVAVLSSGTSDKSIVPLLLEIAEETGSITDRWFKYTRKGTGRNTSYILYARDRGHNVDESVEQYELVDLSRVVRKVPYAEQEEFYAVVAEAQDGDEQREPVSVASNRGSVDPDEDW